MKETLFPTEETHCSKKKSLSLTLSLPRFPEFIHKRKTWNQPHESTAQKLSFEWSHTRVSSTDLKVRTILSWLKSMTLGMKGLNTSSSSSKQPREITYRALFPQTSLRKVAYVATSERFFTTSYYKYWQTLTYSTMECNYKIYWDNMGQAGL